VLLSLFFSLSERPRGAPRQLRSLPPLFVTRILTPGKEATGSFPRQIGLQHGVPFPTALRARRPPSKAEAEGTGQKGPSSELIVVFLPSGVAIATLFFFEAALRHDSSGLSLTTPTSRLPQNLNAWTAKYLPPPHHDAAGLCPFDPTARSFDQQRQRWFLSRALTRSQLRCMGKPFRLLRRRHGNPF